MCTRNDHRVEAGEPGRTLANGDLLRIDAITAEGLLVRRALDADRQTGRRRWTDRQFLYADFADAELGYAVTAHVAQGRTVRTGLAVFTGSEDRQHAYVALTRGTDNNTAYVFTTPTKLSDPAPGTRPAPELARYDRLTAQADSPAPADPDDPGTTSAVNVLDRDHRRPRRRQAVRVPGMAAGPVRRRPPGRPARDVDRRDRPGPRTALPRPAPVRAARREPASSDSHTEQWLHRTLRAAELAGLDPARSWPGQSPSGT